MKGHSGDKKRTAMLPFSVLLNLNFLNLEKVTGELVKLIDDSNFSSCLTFLGRDDFKFYFLIFFQCSKTFGFN